MLFDCVSERGVSDVKITDDSWTSFNRRLLTRLARAARKQANPASLLEVEKECVPLLLNLVFYLFSHMAADGIIFSAV